FLRDGKLFVVSTQRVEFLLFYIVFIISLVRGLIVNRDIVFTLRQSAIIYYSVFYFLVPIILDNLKKILSSILSISLNILIKLSIPFSSDNLPINKKYLLSSLFL
ncbi:unnamed protein product, partial [marine sediment metagenome]